jgi:signal peptidase II
MGGSLPGNGPFWLFTVGVAVLLAGLLVLLLRSHGLGTRAQVGLSLALAGGVSNWWDRWVNDGRVVDFLNLGLGPVRTGIFNVADVAIMAGVALVLLASARPPREAD